ncbi:AAA family ATPase [Paenibacillus agaridevorans]|uniref:AAA family ATPase n=1 Tax=Paenibacillus agaridevorans TaxID=171404 RepID=UPI001BE48B5D|nr:ATP-binding protein [Paenibacillus agaridevorans]
MARHFESMSVSSFRGTRDLSIHDLGDLNIIVGNNNSGKTSVLEALMILGNPADFNNVISTSRIREGGKATFRTSLSLFDSFIYMFDSQSEHKQILLSGKMHSRAISFELDGEVRKILVDAAELAQQSLTMKRALRDSVIEEEIEGFEGVHTYNIQMEQRTFFDEIPVKNTITFHKYVKKTVLDRHKPIVNMMFISTTEHLVQNIFKNISRSKQMLREVIDILQTFDAGIEDLRIIQDDIRYVQMIEHKTLGLMPLSSYGDGIKKVIALANGIAGTKDGVLLIDEIETSIHKSVMKEVFSWLVRACKRYNVQLFMTTHSLEVVDELLNCDEIVMQEDMARVITLNKKADKTVARVLTGEKAVQVRDDYDMELRS